MEIILGVIILILFVGLFIAFLNNAGLEDRVRVLESKARVFEFRSMTKYCEEYANLLGKNATFKQDWDYATFYKEDGNWCDSVKYADLTNEIEKVKRLACCKTKKSVKRK